MNAGATRFSESDTPERVLTLLGCAVLGVERDAAPRSDLIRYTAICFEDGRRFPVPLGNRLRSGADLAEIRALLAGWPRSAAKALRIDFSHASPDAALEDIEAVLDAWAMAPELAEDAAARGLER